MGGKKMMTSAVKGLSKPLRLNKKQKSKQEYNENISNFVVMDDNLRKPEEKKKNKSIKKKRRNSLDKSSIEGEHIDEKKRSKLKNKKRRKENIIDVEIGEVDEASTEMELTPVKKEMEGNIDEQNSIEAGEKTKKIKKKKRKIEKMKKAEIHEVGEVHNQVEDGSGQLKGKSKRGRKMKRKEDRTLSKNDEEKGEAEEEYEVYEMSSGDEDSTAGMKKWMMEYHQSRPGLEILQQKIDNFITAHEEQEEQARKEREARIAEDGWTVVVHHKGRKKTTDSESGVAVGSVAQAAVMDKLSKKKTKDVSLDFYRFQKREAQRNEIMMLQSKFEQDKKRIQQLRAARKFRPY